MSEPKMLVLGRLAKPHSIQGEIRVDYFAESPQLLDKPLLIRAGNLPPRPLNLAGWRLWKGQPVLRLHGVEDRTQAELLRGQELLIAEADLPLAEPDEPYIKDLLGLPVYAGRSERAIGVLNDVLLISGQEIWSILTIDGVEILFPAVPDFMDEIDLNSGAIYISPPPGLLEVYLDPAADG